MEYLEVIKKRRSIRKFQNKPVSKEVIDVIIESARIAPSGSNSQGWLFGVVTDPAIIKKLAQAAGNQMWITTAPLVITLCADVSWRLSPLPDDNFGLMVNNKRFTPEMIDYLKKYPDQRQISLVLANADTMIPGEHIALTAVNFGLSSCWVGLLDIKEASRILNLPEKYACFFLMPIGYEDEGPRSVKRKAVKDIAFMNSFSNKYSYTKAGKSGKKGLF